MFDLIRKRSFPGYVESYYFGIHKFVLSKRKQKKSEVKFYVLKFLKFCDEKNIGNYWFELSLDLISKLLKFSDFIFRFFDNFNNFESQLETLTKL